MSPSPPPPPPIPLQAGNYSLHFFIAIKEVVNSLDDPTTAGLILEEQAKSLKNILADPAIQHLIKVCGYLIVKLTNKIIECAVASSSGFS